MKNLFVTVLMSLSIVMMMSCSKEESDELNVPNEPSLAKAGMYMPVPAASVILMKSTSADGLISEIEPLELKPLPDEFSSNLVLYYPFTDGTEDEINFLDGKVLGINDSPASYNDIKDSTYIEVPENAVLDFQSKEFTICVWFNNNGRSKPNEIQGIFGRQTSAGNSGIFAQLTTAKDTGYYEYASIPKVISYNEFYVDGTPCNLLGVKGEDGWSYVYENENLLNGWHFVTITGNGSDIANRLEANWLIARECDAVDANGKPRYFYGALDEVMFFDRKLSAEEVMELYKLKK